jgi:hypothetical protein
MKLVEPNLSAPSSEEDSFVAGISTIGLQNKRFSRPQRKILTRERKMGEGTWTFEKPPSKTPSSQAKGFAEGSGSVKNTTHTTVHILKKTATEKPVSPRCRLRYTRKLYLESRWRSSTDSILT